MSEEHDELTPSEARIARAVVRELQKEFRIGVGKTVLDHVWKVIITVFFAAAIMGLSQHFVLQPVTQAAHN